MSGMSSIYQPGPYHIIAYGTLLGSSIFQSFIGGVTAFKVLPRSSFAQLQKALFPIYFSMQTGLSVILALTYPIPHQTPASTTSPISALLFDPEHRYSALLPIALTFVGGLVNLTIVGPATTKVMQERKHQETRDGKKYFDEGPHTEEMKKLNSKFGVLHGVSSLVNMVAVIATIGYGWVLGARLE